jgi:radical SAM protein with 4Fe4S-binding SPASM domain
MPCVGVNIPIGNIRERELGSILSDSEIVENLKDYRRRIKGPCRDCEEGDHCYGCRGAAYQLTGDYLASDPLCWRNIDRQEDITRLPVSVDRFLPQKAPMRVVDTLVEIGERRAEVTTTITEDMIFAGDDGILDEVLYLELLAQAIASEGSFNQTGSSLSGLQGLLLGAKKLEILEPARVGDTLNISVCKFARLGDFGIVKGEIRKGNTVLARGEIKIWHRTEESTTELETGDGGDVKQ